jgi:hypothetical protein
MALCGSYARVLRGGYALRPQCIMVLSWRYGIRVGHPCTLDDPIWPCYRNPVTSGYVSGALVIHGSDFLRPRKIPKQSITQILAPLARRVSYAVSRYLLTLRFGLKIILRVYSFTEVAFSIGPLLWRLRPGKWRSYRAVSREDDEDADPSEQVPTLWWISGLLVSVLLSSVILSGIFGMSILQALFSLLIGFLFSFIGIQSSGQTDVNPIGTVAKASQVIFGGLTRHAAISKSTAQTINLTAGVVAAGCAGQATDMVSIS